MAANQDIEPEEIEVEEEEGEEEEGPRKKRSPIIVIILVLLILALLCVVCLYFFRNNLPIPGNPPPPPQPTIPAIETPVTSPTSEPVESPTAETPATEQPSPTSEQPLPTSEQPVPTEPPAATEQPTEQPVPTEQPTEQPVPTEQPTEQPVPTEPPATVEPAPSETVEPGEVTVVPTTEPVPGPTATPTLGPTPDTTPAADCSNNTPPVAEAGGPYNAMMGKGDAFVTVDGSGSSDADGSIGDYAWDFGDGSPVQSGVSAMHGYSSTGSFVITLTVMDNCGEMAQDTADATIVGPTPPATGTVTATPPVTSTVTATPPATSTVTLPPTGQGPHDGTLGFCYRVQYGNTLSGIAGYFGVPWPDLAMVNGVSPEYYVIEGQGLFIPTEPIRPGPNLYQVEGGDTMYSIAYQCGLPVGKLAHANGANPDQPLTPGDLVVIPLWGWY